jgi:hypothetical protein
MKSNSYKLPKYIIRDTKSKKEEYSRAISSLQQLRKFNTKLILGHGEMSTKRPFFKVPENKIVVMFVKVGCELGDKTTSIFWNAIASDPDNAYVQKILLSNEKAMPDNFLFKHKLIYPPGSYCPNVYTTLGCSAKMKSGVYNSEQIKSTKYENLPCVKEIYGKVQITTENIIKHSKSKTKEIYVSYTCLFLRNAENPFTDISYTKENIPLYKLKAIIECASNLTKHANEIFISQYNLFPIKYTPFSVLNKPGVILEEYDKRKYHKLRIFEIFDNKGENFWEKMSYYTKLKYYKENKEYLKYTKTYNSMCGEILNN